MKNKGVGNMVKNMIVVIMVAIIIVTTLMTYNIWKTDYERIIATPAINLEKANSVNGDLYGISYKEDKNSFIVSYYYRNNGGKRVICTHNYNDDGIWISGTSVEILPSKKIANENLKSYDDYNIFTNVIREGNIIKADFIKKQENKYEFIASIRELIERSNLIII